MLGDKGYDADWFRNALIKRGIVPCIPSKANRKLPIAHDQTLYRQRHKIENMFGKLKDWHEHLRNPVAGCHFRTHSALFSLAAPQSGRCRAPLARGAWQFATAKKREPALAAERAPGRVAASCEGPARRRQHRPLLFSYLAWGMGTPGLAAGAGER